DYRRQRAEVASLDPLSEAQPVVTPGPASEAADRRPGDGPAARFMAGPRPGRPASRQGTVRSARPSDAAAAHVDLRADRRPPRLHRPAVRRGDPPRLGPDHQGAGAVADLVAGPVPDQPAALAV